MPTSEMTTLSELIDEQIEHEEELAEAMNPSNPDYSKRDQWRKAKDALPQEKAKWQAALVEKLEAARKEKLEAIDVGRSGAVMQGTLERELVGLAALHLIQNIAAERTLTKAISIINGENKK